MENTRPDGRFLRVVVPLLLRESPSDDLGHQHALPRRVDPAFQTRGLLENAQRVEDLVGESTRAFQPVHFFSKFSARVRENDYPRGDKLKFI